MGNRVVVTGGAGYIGSHTVLALTAAGFDPIVLDNLSTGHRDLVADDAVFVRGDLSDRSLLRSLFEKHHADAIIHFAASAYVGESVENPRKYYENNVSNTVNLLGAALDMDIHNVVFSSSCAVYGQPDVFPIDEETPQSPINPYGRTKSMIEAILTDYEKAFDFRSVKLRYFNVAGADPKLRTGERHNPETHILPIILEAAAGRRDGVTIFGTDYATEDGTCVRDYVHVSDLAEAHVVALQHLLRGGEPLELNVGLGRGFSVRELIDSAQRVTGNVFDVTSGERRPGDPAKLVAATSRIRQRLGWVPTYESIAEIVESAWRWHQKDWHHRKPSIRR